MFPFPFRSTLRRWRERERERKPTAARPLRAGALPPSAQPARRSTAALAAAAPCFARVRDRPRRSRHTSSRRRSGIVGRNSHDARAGVPAERACNSLDIASQSSRRFAAARPRRQRGLFPFVRIRRGNAVSRGRYAPRSSPRSARRTPAPPFADAIAIARADRVAAVIALARFRRRLNRHDVRPPRPRPPHRASHRRVAARVDHGTQVPDADPGSSAATLTTLVQAFLRNAPATRSTSHRDLCGTSLPLDRNDSAVRFPSCGICHVTATPFCAGAARRALRLTPLGMLRLRRSQIHSRLRTPPGSPPASRWRAAAVGSTRTSFNRRITGWRTTLRVGAPPVTPVFVHGPVHCRRLDCRTHCRHCRGTARQGASHHCPRSRQPGPPLTRRGGSPPPGSPASIPRTSMLPIRLSRPHGAALGSTPDASLMQVSQ